MRSRALLAALLLLVAGIGQPTFAATKTIRFTAEVWADNWFELYVNGKRVGQDSIAFKTERSFNMDRIAFSASYPLTIGLVAKDYVENASGLEYIGKPNQQIGDGGVIMQIRETDSRRLVAVTDKSWKVLVVNTSPTNASCVTSAAPVADCKSLTRATPKGWFTALFNASSWKSATEHTEQAVGVKDGYLQVAWDPSARLVWSSDLKLDNTLLLRKRVTSPSTTSAAAGFLIDAGEFPSGLLPKPYTCDGIGTSPALSWSLPPSGTRSLAVVMDGEAGPPRPGEASITHYYWVLYNLPVADRQVLAGFPGLGTLGMNFKDRTPGYTPPCSQGPGAKQYRIRVFALTQPVDLAPTAATGDALLAAITNTTLATATLQVSYTRP